MTPDLHALATQLAADLATLHRAGRIASVWRPGMLDSDGDRVLAVDPIDSRKVRYTEDKWYTHGDPGPTIPDLSDDATVDGVVRLAREAWGEPGLCLIYDHTDECWSVGLWEAEGLCLRGRDGPTEAAAACAAIRDAAAGVGT